MEEVTMAMAIYHIADAFMYVGIAWAVAWGLVGFFRAITK